ncbi:3-oxoacyl-[acyl-carrier protein] reductase [Quadrisphaera granulorum]|uniref:3-oxoacyl-[acyl-carrier protein] reductase n=1 Tax=Quadrisphaera granulorum TaxID=317664 RepID=A0A316ACN1_9ACTN|nr:3-oxoacyl-ACP reductase [Quadrisphaera granulorum]PWJ54644.1 3-oxoacyl-[acyl-carrier protein] reductase [Quadrisphaera granulorum]SZE96006.1 3-oxoacyl-[acyl-carrier protein] reductase [Quadrisphaera granulorum]
MAPATRPRDLYAELVRTGPGAALARKAGLPRPALLRRFEAGAPLLVGPALVLTVGSGASAFRTREAGGALASLLTRAGADVQLELAEQGQRLGAVVVDATGATDVGDLAALGLALGPAVRRLAPSSRVILVGRTPGDDDVEAAAVQQGLEGITRTVGKELRAGATANLLRLSSGAGAAELAGPLAFVASPRSAFVDGQVIEVARSAHDDDARDALSRSERPLEGAVAVVTGAARGIGRATAQVLARQGAHVVVVDVPAASGDLARTANGVRGEALALDVTAGDAPARLAEHLGRRLGERRLVVVHNAGITRDRLLVNLDAARWESVLAVNLAAPLRLTEALVEADLLGGGARVVGVSSTSGLAGNRGQANYAASKAGVAGMVRALAPRLAELGGTANAVAPGFIETEMTAKIPPVLRQLGRRTASLQQGGLPVDVAETVAWLAEPASVGVTGQVVRVCGQALVGA